MVKDGKVREKEAKRESESAGAFSLSTGGKGWQGERKRGKEKRKKGEKIIERRPSITTTTMRPHHRSRAMGGGACSRGRR